MLCSVLFSYKYIRSLIHYCPLPLVGSNLFRRLPSHREASSHAAIKTRRLVLCTTRYSFIHNHALGGHHVHTWVGEEIARCSRHPTTTARWHQLHQETMESSRKQNGCSASCQNTMIAGDVCCDVDSIITNALIHCHNTRNQTNHTFYHSLPYTISNTYHTLYTHCTWSCKLCKAPLLSKVTKGRACTLIVTIANIHAINGNDAIYA